MMYFTFHLSIEHLMRASLQCSFSEAASMPRSVDAREQPTKRWVVVVVYIPVGGNAAGCHRLLDDEGRGERLLGNKVSN